MNGPIRFQWNNGLMLDDDSQWLRSFFCVGRISPNDHSDSPFYLFDLVASHYVNSYIYHDRAVGNHVKVETKTSQSPTKRTKSVFVCPPHKILWYTAFQYTLCSGEMAVQQINTMEFCIHLTFVIITWICSCSAANPSARPVSGRRLGPSEHSTCTAIDFVDASFMAGIAALTNTATKMRLP